MMHFAERLLGLIAGFPNVDVFTSALAVDLSFR